MAALNEVRLQGRLTDDPELKFTPNGHAIVRFRMAVTERRFNRETSQWEDGSSLFIDVDAWRQLAEAFMSAKPVRGMEVRVEGSLRISSYERDGERRYRTYVDATSVLFPVVGYQKVTVEANGSNRAANTSAPATDTTTAAGATTTVAAPAATTSPLPGGDEPPF